MSTGEGRKRTTLSGPISPDSDQIHQVWVNLVYYSNFNKILTPKIHYSPFFKVPDVDARRTSSSRDPDPEVLDRCQ